MNNVGTKQMHSFINWFMHSFSAECREGLIGVYYMELQLEQPKLT